MSGARIALEIIMRLTLFVLVLVALFAVVRIGLVLRRDRSRAHDDWDARLVKNLRAAGGNAFTPYEVDFFFSLPDEASLPETARPTRGRGLCDRYAWHDRRSERERLVVARAQAPAGLGRTRCRATRSAFVRSPSNTAATTTAGRAIRASSSLRHRNGEYTETRDTPIYWSSLGSRLAFGLIGHRLGGGADRFRVAQVAA